MPPKAKKRRTSSLPSEVQTPISTRKAVKIADDVDEVLAKCRLLRKQLVKKAKDEESKASEQSTLPKAEALNFKDDEISIVSDLASIKNKSIVEVSEMSALEVTESIESVAVQIANQILDKRGFKLEIPSRSSANQIYLPELDRIVLGDKKMSRSFLNVNVRSFHFIR
jgi:meiotic recombination protein SPO11